MINGRVPVTTTGFNWKMPTVDEKHEAANSCCVLRKLHMHTKLENGVQAPVTGSRSRVPSLACMSYKDTIGWKIFALRYKLFCANTMVST